VREDALTTCGYDVLTQSAEYGVDSFVKKKKRSLFVHFQGHPEYGVATLIEGIPQRHKRFLRHERETYPSMPLGYFDPEATRLLADFQEKALSSPSEEALNKLSLCPACRKIKNTWHSSANLHVSQLVAICVIEKGGVSGVCRHTRVGSARSRSITR